MRPLWARYSLPLPKSWLRLRLLAPRFSRGVLLWGREGMGNKSLQLGLFAYLSRVAFFPRRALIDQTGKFRIGERWGGKLAMDKPFSTLLLCCLIGLWAGGTAWAAPRSWAQRHPRLHAYGRSGESVSRLPQKSKAPQAASVLTRPRSSHAPVKAAVSS